MEEKDVLEQIGLVLTGDENIRHIARHAHFDAIDGIFNELVWMRNGRHLLTFDVLDSVYMSEWTYQTERLKAREEVLKAHEFCTNPECGCVTW